MKNIKSVQHYPITSTNKKLISNQKYTEIDSHCFDTNILQKESTWRRET